MKNSIIIIHYYHFQTGEMTDQRPDRRRVISAECKREVDSDYKDNDAKTIPPPVVALTKFLATIISTRSYFRQTNVC